MGRPANYRGAMLRYVALVVALGTRMAFAALTSTPYATTTYAGAGKNGHLDGAASQAWFSYPTGIVYDAADHSLYVVDGGYNDVRKISSTGVVATVASGLSHPFGMTLDPDNGNLYVTDAGNNTIVEVTPAGGVRTIASGSFANPTGIVYDPVDRALYVSDTAHNRIARVTLEGKVTTLAGGTVGYAEGTGNEARFSNPTGITVDPATGALYACDLNNRRIRKVTLAGVVTTYAGQGERGLVDGPAAKAQFTAPSGIVFDAADGSLYVVETTPTIFIKHPRAVVGLNPLAWVVAAPLDAQAENKWATLYRAPSHVVRRIGAHRVVTTIAGDGKRGDADGTGSQATFDEPFGIAVDPASGTLYVADSGNNRIRRLAPIAKTIGR